jgi:hypothetical protein
MPQTSTKEFTEAVADLIVKYTNRCTTIELVGALTLLTENTIALFVQENGGEIAGGRLIFSDTPRQPSEDPTQPYPTDDK